MFFTTSVNLKVKTKCKVLEYIHIKYGSTHVKQPKNSNFLLENIIC